MEGSLLLLIHHHKLPLSTFKSVQEWAQNAAEVGHDFNWNIQSNRRVLEDFQDQMDIPASKFKHTI